MTNYEGLHDDGTTVEQQLCCKTVAEAKATCEYIEADTTKTPSLPTLRSTTLSMRFAEKEKELASKEEELAKKEEQLALMRERLLGQGSGGAGFQARRLLGGFGRRAGFGPAGFGSGPLAWRVPGTR